MDQPLPAHEGAALVRQHTPGYAEQPRDGITAVAGEPRRRTKRAKERFTDHVRDVTSVGASRDRVAQYLALMTAVETAERLGIAMSRGGQQVRVGLVHTYYLPAPGPAFQTSQLGRKSVRRRCRRAGR
jgi:hypothetical protein